MRNWDSIYAELEQHLCGTGTVSMRNWNSIHAELE